MTPDLLAPVCFLAAALLVLAGVVKVVRPRSTAQALLDAGLPGSFAIARGVGVVEVGVGIWALVAPASGGAIALGLLYLVFATFLGYVMHAHPEAGSCGCAGPTPVPPSRLHLVLNGVAGSAGLTYAAIGGPSAAIWLDGLGVTAVPVFAGLALAGWLAVVAVTQAPAAFRAWEAPVHDHDAEPRGHDHAIADHELTAVGIEPGHPSLWPGVKEAG